MAEYILGTISNGTGSAQLAFQYDIVPEPKLTGFTLNNGMTNATVAAEIQNDEGQWFTFEAPPGSAGNIGLTGNYTITITDGEIDQAPNANFGGV